MKNAEKYLSKYNCDPKDVALTGDKIVELIKQSQIDAYNEAIDDAIKNAKIKEHEYNNPYSESDGKKTYSVDKNSLLKLKKNGKEKTYKPGFYQFNIK